MVIFIKNVSRCRYTIYLGGVQIKMPNSQGSFDISSSRTSGNEQTSKSDMENVVYNFTLSYGTC